MPEKTMVVKSGLPLYLEGSNGRAVLVIHGYTGYPGEFYELAEHINQEGYTVCLPRLPGHGTNRRDFFRTGWRDWVNQVRNTYMDMATSYSSVSVIGLSMGGALALILASEFSPDRAAVMAPTMAVSNRLFYLAPILRFFIRSMKKKKGVSQEADPDRMYLGSEYWQSHYPGQLAKLLKVMRLARKGLQKVTCPTLIILSEKDSSVPLKAGQILEKKLVHAETRKVILKNSPHVIVKGPEKAQVFSETIAWLAGAQPGQVRK